MPLRWAGSLASSLIASVLSRLGRYRALDASERADAEFVFGESIDLSRVRIALPGRVHRLLFALQRLLQAGRRPRPFATGWLVHVPPGRALEREVLIHELTHVWQAQVYGPCYLWQALHAQLFGEGYDYASSARESSTHACGVDGDGAEEALRSRSFFSFNREQQAQIVMHYFVRRVLRGESEEACAPWAAHARAMREADTTRAPGGRA